MVSRPIPEEFLVAFSFAGEQRDLVREIAEEVERRLGPGSTFFDEWYEHYIAGDDADLRLQEVYRERTVMVVPCLSERYDGKSWTQAEYKAIRGLQLKLSESTDKNAALRILPLRVGEGEVRGFFENTICLDVRKRPIESTAELIVNRLRVIRPEAVCSSPTAAASQKFVFLAECTPDLEESSKPINRGRMKAWLEDLGWSVLPRAEYPEGQYQALLEKDLKECRAFVQLLGPYPWKRGGFDRVQKQAAAALGIRRFSFRSAEIDLTQVEPAHREFLASPDVIFTSFDDFLVHLRRELTVLSEPPPPPADPNNPPLVRVVIHSTNPDELWERVFHWLYEQENILSEQLAPGKTLEAKHRREPCHGFLVVCDAAALEDGPMSPRENMEQCRLIQMKEKNAARRPPVALVYWPPPAPSWARLLRCTPLKLHRVMADVPNVPAELAEFFAEVRRVAR